MKTKSKLPRVSEDGLHLLYAGYNCTESMSIDKALAAPDLFEAAQFAIKTVGDCNCDKVCCIHYQTEKTLRAAIKKATGESQ